jgi:acyl carrier protein
MNRSDIVISLYNYISETFLFGQDKNLKADDSLLEKGIIDSTGIIEFIEFIESTFLISVEAEEIIPNNFDSIDRAAAFVTRKRADL